MSWPLSQDYNEAVQSPATSFSDPELRQGEVATNALGLPRPRSGNFADVYEFHCPATGNRWALKCFTREVHGLHERYSEVSKHLEQSRLPFGVDFQYLEQGVRVRGSWFPLLKMRWVEGFTLNEFVRQHLDRPALLEALLRIWVRMAGRLRGAGLAHADLQHGNVLLVPGSNAQSLAVKLIDYDGMWVPALAGKKSGEVGHPAFQHPQRLREGLYSSEVDRFPLLVVATALRALQVGGNDLWKRHDNGDNLLFREKDLADPGQSPLFAELAQLGDVQVRQLVQQLQRAATLPLDQTPLLTDLLPELAATEITRVKPATAVRTAPVGVVQAVPVEAPAVPAFAFEQGEAPTVRRRSSGKEKSSLLPWVLGGVGTSVALLVGGIALGVALVRSDKGTTTADKGIAPREQVKAVVLDRAQPREEERPQQELKPPDRPQDPPMSDVPVVVRPMPGGRPFPVMRMFGSTVPEPVAAAFSPDGRFLALGGSRDVRIFDPVKLTRPYLLNRSGSHLSSLAFSPDGSKLLLGGSARTAPLWDLNENRVVLTLTMEQGTTHHVCISPDGSKALVAGLGTTPCLFDLATGQIVQRFPHPCGVPCAAFSPDGKYVLTGVTAGEGQASNYLYLWEAETGKQVRTFAGHTHHVWAVAFSRDGAQAVSGSLDKTVRLWDVATGQERKRFEGHTDFVKSVALSPDGRHILSGSDDKTVRLWDVASGQEVARNGGNAGTTSCVAFSADGKYALWSSSDGRARFTRVPGAKPVPPGMPPSPSPVSPTRPPTPVVGLIRTKREFPWAIRGLFVSADGQTVVASARSNMRVWETSTGQSRGGIGVGGIDSIESVALLPDNQTVLFQSKGGISAWSFQQSPPRVNYNKFRGELRRFVLAPDGRTVLVVTPSNSVIVWDVQTGQTRANLAHPDVRVAAISADGRRVLTGGKMGGIRLWDLASPQKPRRQLRGSDGAVVNALAFAPDGRHALSGSADKIVRLWDLEASEAVRLFEGHTAGVEGVAFTKDGKRALSCGGDGTLRLWNVATGKEQQNFTGHTGTVWAVACLPDGRQAVSVGDDGTLRVWGLPEPAKEGKTPLVAGSTPIPMTERKPAPSKEEQSAAGEQLEANYHTKERRGHAEAVALVVKLLDLGKKSDEAANVRFAALRKASELAVRTGEIDLSFQALDALARVFTVDAHAEKVAALRQASAQTSTLSGHKLLAERGLALAREAEAADDYAGALALFEFVKAAAVKGGSEALRREAYAKAQDVQRLKTEYAKLADAVQTLKEKPGDGAASLQLGCFFCLYKEDWKRGLPLLVAGSDASLAELARRDLAAPREVKDQLALGQSWWDAGGQKTGTHRAALQLRGQFWLRRALPNLSGPEKAEAENRLKLTLNRLQLTPGLVAELFTDEELRTRVKTRTDYQVDFNWGPNAADPALDPDLFSIRWSGYLVPPRKGLYTLLLHADDGARLYLDGNKVIDTWKMGGPRAVEVNLDRKPHSLRLDYHEGIGMAQMTFRWKQKDGFAEQPVPLEALYHDATQAKLLQAGGTAGK